MKKHFRLLMPLLLAITLSACGGTESQAAETSVAAVYTSVAMTVTAQAASIIPTSTMAPTLTPAATLSIASPMIGSILPTSQVSAASVSACDNSTFISDVTIPDGTIVAPGLTFTKTWLFQNTGSCTWSEDYTLTFMSGEDMEGSATTIDASVAPGGQVKVSVDLTAPDEEGTHTGYWILANEAESTFGVHVYVQIVVSDDASTITPTVTTEADTSTPTSTAIPSTSTFTPSPIPADTATSTSSTDTNSLTDPSS